MAILAADLASMLDVTVNVLYVAVGLGLVIFFHELGHFAVAKWCGVLVERFSIGFGPVIWSFKKGDTEYALSAIPFGGYVKMLGQDDMDPSQLTNEEIAEDPRSYSAKSVPQRMAIISAGVIMNIITGLLFFAVAFRMGVDSPAPVLGHIVVGYPAWERGLEFGDRITRINGRDVSSFGDIMRGVALTSGAVTIEGIHREGTTFKVTLHPDESSTRRVIGAAPSESLNLIVPPEKDFPVVDPGSPAAQADGEFRAGDEIRKVGGQDVSTFAELQELLANRRDQPLDFSVKRKKGKDKLANVTVRPNAFRSLGLWVDIGQIAAIQKDSPADGGLKVGDKISHVNDLEVGKDIDPLRLPDFFFKEAGNEVEVRVRRKASNAETQEVSVTLTPRAKHGWIERPRESNNPVSVPAIGVAFHLIPTVLKVEEGSATEDAGIQPNQRLRKMAFVLPKGQESDNYKQRSVEVEFGQKDDDGQPIQNYAFAFWMMQETPTRTIELTVSDQEGQLHTKKLKARPVEGWFVPDTRGLRLRGMAEQIEADGTLSAISMGLGHTRNWIIDIYLTLRNLLTGRISPKEMHGPIGIAKVAYQVAAHGMPELLLFLGMLSVNLAVLNFLPIPVLDGGHMVFLLWEGIARKKPSERVLSAAQVIGLVFVLGLMIAVIYLDIFVHK